MGGGIGKKTQREIREDQTPLDTPACILVLDFSIPFSISDNRNILLIIGEAVNIQDLNIKGTNFHIWLDPMWIWKLVWIGFA